VRRGRTTVVAVAMAVVLTLAATACVSPDHSAHTTGTPTPVTGGVTPSSTPATSTPASTRPPITPTPLGRYRLSGWSDCKGGFECATLVVPLDWSKPAGRTISLAVIRKPATGPGARVGSVLMNPGGPGEPGTGFLRDIVGAGRLPKALGQRLDLVSWDPRGTGGSGGVDCLTEQQLLAPDPDPTLDTPAEAAAYAANASTLLKGCQTKDGFELPYLGTRNTVRDLDALRSALGDPKLTYVGFSYGTTVGAIYAQMFPTRVRALVLDGVTAVGADPVVDTHDQALSFEKNLEAFLADCASRTSCLFGHGDPRGEFLRLVAQLEAGQRLPATYSLPDASGTDHQRRGTVGIGEFYTGVITPLYSRDDWIALEQALAGAENGDGKLLLYLRDQLEGRQDDGSFNGLPEANVAINCADQTLRPSNPSGDPALRAQWVKEMPLLGAVFAAGTPGCAGWPAAKEPLSTLRPGAIKGVPPIVLIGATGDPATPYAQAVAEQALIPGSRLVTWESDDHTAYGRGSACLDEPVTSYLVDLTVPSVGLRCKP